MTVAGHGHGIGTRLRRDHDLPHFDDRQGTSEVVDMGQGSSPPRSCRRCDSAPVAQRYFQVSVGWHRSRTMPARGGPFKDNGGSSKTVIAQDDVRLEVLPDVGTIGSPPPKPARGCPSRTWEGVVEGRGWGRDDRRDDGRRDDGRRDLPRLDIPQGSSEVMGMGSRWCRTQARPGLPSEDIGGGLVGRGGGIGSALEESSHAVRVISCP